MKTHSRIRKTFRALSAFILILGFLSCQSTARKKAEPTVNISEQELRTKVTAIALKESSATVDTLMDDAFRTHRAAALSGLRARRGFPDPLAVGHPPEKLLILQSTIL